MPQLQFKVSGLKTDCSTLVPLLRFQLEITNKPDTERIQAITLQTQIQWQPARRAYSTAEQERLVEVFGQPQAWSQSLRNKLWTLVPCNVGPFSGTTEVTLPVPCTFDLNVVASKYFLALEEASVSLLFLFTGSVFFSGQDGRLQVAQIPWESECGFLLSPGDWRRAMESVFPNAAWVEMHRDVHEHLCCYKRQAGHPTWDKTLESLLRNAINSATP